MKRKKQLKATTVNSVYKKYLQDNFRCKICPPNRGCNANGKFSDNRSWKRNRKHQWKD